METKNVISLLDRDSANISNQLAEYRKTFKETLSDFMSEHKLDKAVIRKNGDKTEKGELNIISDNKIGYKDNIAVPCYFIFIPYRKTGELSDVKRTDKFDVNTPSEYFKKILEIYSPAED